MQKGNKFTIKTLKKDLTLDIRAFLKRHAKNLKGPGKVAILVFYIIKSKNQSTGSSEIRSQWNGVRAKSILGKYDTTYLVRAREYGFLKKDPNKRRHYQLTNSWLEEINNRYRK